MSTVLDLDQLRLMTSGDADLAAEALGIFRSQADMWGRLLDPHADAVQWADAAHAIKGAAKSVGLVDLGEACTAAETLGRSGGASPAQAGVAISTIKDKLGEAIEAIAHVEHQLLMRRSFDGVRVA